MTKAKALGVGDRVSWNTSQGRTRGVVVGRKTRDFEFADQRFTATEADPTFLVQSDKSGGRAAHKRRALRRLSQP